ncbi:hypothetical protein FHR71_001998 [Methylobacterium sp. RAS18]|nr:hypothetical protein [Methylobacterium sp. RAS18]
MRFLLMISGLSALLAGCGINVPQIKEPWEGETASRQLTFGIKRRVYCELKAAILAVNNDIAYGKQKTRGGRFLRYYPIPHEWGARVSLALTVDEKGALGPSVAVIDPLEAAQAFSVGLGAELSSTATRIEKFDAFYTVKFMDEQFRDDSVCFDRNYKFWENPSRSSPLITSDLNLEKWLKDAAFTTRNLRSDDPEKVGAGTIPDTFSLEVKFVVVTNGTANPSWKLTRVTSNTSGLPLFAAGRTRTHDLLITIGPPTKETADSHLASQIGQSIAANARVFFQP